MRRIRVQQVLGHGRGECSIAVSFGCWRAVPPARWGSELRARSRAPRLPPAGRGRRQYEKESEGAAAGDGDAPEPSCEGEPQVGAGGGRELARGLHPDDVTGRTDRREGGEPALLEPWDRI